MTSTYLSWLRKDTLGGDGFGGGCDGSGGSSDGSVSRHAALQLKPVDVVAQDARLGFQLIEAGGEGCAGDEPHVLGLRGNVRRSAERGGRWELTLSRRT